MKNIFGSLFLGSILLFAILLELAGIYFMINAVLSDAPTMMKGIELFSFGLIIFVVVISGYMISKILSYNELMVDTLTNLLEHTLNKEKMNQSSSNIMDSLFGGFGLPGSGTIKMAKLDEDGNITPFGEKEFESPEDFLKQRDELLSKVFGNKPDGSKKKIEDMTLSELEEAKDKAVNDQDFKLAACLRDAINQKKNVKE